MFIDQGSGRCLADGSDSVSVRVVFKMSDRVIVIKRPDWASNSGMLELAHIAYEKTLKFIGILQASC